MDKCKAVPTPQVKGNFPMPGNSEVEPMEGCMYAYSSRKQRLMTDATWCAEFVAASECSTLIMGTHNLCKELGLRRKITILYGDNQAAIAVISANTGDYKVKGVDLKYHKIRDYVECGEFTLEYCPSEDNLADILTKTLGPTHFKKLRYLLNMMPMPTNMGGKAKIGKRAMADEMQI
ncbi:Retrotransposon tca4 Polyprotein [Phytophthora megakarya]|uniref:Retrotransposon tca4 Polyprotein n=1 Tax=Phytophthora megakarya TaxID=4795 RepID=A0A225VV48_9STRA|nr:Retrotransposon tca4 Polyprotein [Phytophthora megakarya]